MGAKVFFTVSEGVNVEDAFRKARARAHYEHGHLGYTGTIAEKEEYVMIECPIGTDAQEYAEKLIRVDDERITNKWGPAGCIPDGNGHYLFFGWASS